jgi:hypothetical protein
MASIPDEPPNESDDVFAEAAGGASALDALRAEAARRNERWSEWANVAGRQSILGLVEGLAETIGVRPDGLSPEEQGGSWSERRAAAKARRPYIERGYRVALRAIQLTRQIANSGPASEHWARLTRELDALYGTAVFHDRAEEPCVRLMVLDTLDNVAPESRTVMLMQALAKRRRGERLSKEQDRILAKNTAEKRCAEERIACLVPAAIEELVTADPSEHLRALFLASFDRACPPGEHAQQLRAALHQVDASIVTAALMGWSTRGNAATKWASALRLLTNAGFVPIEQEALRIDWQRWLRERTARSRALGVSNP